MFRPYRMLSPRRPQAGATIYHAMLGIACVALAVAIVFPVYEYVELYTGPVRAYKFPEAGGTPPPLVTPAAPQPAPAPGPVEAAPAEETPAPAEETPTPAREEAPQPVEEPKTEAPAPAE